MAILFNILRLIERMDAEVLFCCKQKNYGSLRLRWGNSVAQRTVHVWDSLLEWDWMLRRRVYSNPAFQCIECVDRTLDSL